MGTDKIRRYVLPNIPYLFIFWCCLKFGTAYRLAAGTGFGEKLIGMIRGKLPWNKPFCLLWQVALVDY